MKVERRVNGCVGYVLLGGVTHVSPSCHVLQFVQGATFRLNVAKVQFDTRNHDLRKKDRATPFKKTNKTRRSFLNPGGWGAY